MCPECHGTGKKGEGSCKKCDGTGKIRRRDVTDEVIIPLPESTTQPIVPQPIAGFISPDLEVWTQYTDELKLLEDLMNNTHWGSIFDTGNQETATGKFIDTQPVINRLNKYSDVAEWMERQLTEMIANYLIPTKNKDENICIISYGRRFIIESPDTILEKYQNAKEKNSPVTVLDRMLSEYLTSKYKNDPESLRLMLTKKEIEPYVHYNLTETKEQFGNDEAQKKMLFTDWWETIDKNTIASKTKDQLKVDFEVWYIEKTGVKLDTQALAVSLGVGGTQSLQAILSDQNLTSDVKKNTLVIVFGLTEENAKLLTQSEPAQPGTNTL
jgi:hypothetical protein